MIRINLIPAYRQEAQQCRRRTARWKTVCGVYATMVGLICATLWISPRASEADSAGAKLDELTRQISMDQQRAAQLRLSLQSVDQNLASAQSISRQPDWSVLLSLVASTAGPEIVLSRLRVESEAPAPPEDEEPNPADTTFEIQISGFGRTQSAVSSYLIRLEGFELFDSLILSKSRREPFLSGDAIFFELVGAFGGADEGES